jgi:hypothetical protein
MEADSAKFSKMFQQILILVKVWEKKNGHFIRISSCVLPASGDQLAYMYQNETIFPAKYAQKNETLCPTQVFRKF